MHDKNLWRRLLSSLVLPFFLIACSPSNHADGAPSAKPVPAPAVAPPGVQLPDFTSLVEREGPAVVNISTTQIIRARGFDFPMPPDISPDDPFYEFFRRFMPPGALGPHSYQSQSLGSGFIISADGYILTNAHVVDGADEVSVKLTDKREFKARVIGADRRSDVALIKIDAKGLPTVAIGNPDHLRVGEWVVAIGSPFGFDNTVTAGIVSGKGRSLPDENYVPFIQTDVPINPGNSGGPLFNMKGEVVGINSQIYSRTGGYMGLSFAIPIDVAMQVTEDLRKHGKVSRGRLGVSIQEISQELAASFGLPKATGALVSNVEKGGPADTAGLRAGDVILKYDGKEVESSRDLPRMVAASRPGSTVKIRVWRDGKALDLDISVGEMPSEGIIARNAGDAKPSANKLGLALRDLSPEQHRQLGSKNGVLVEESDGAAAKAGIRPGDVILAIGNTPLTSSAQFERLLARASTGQTVALLVQRRANTLYVPLKIE